MIPLLHDHDQLDAKIAETLGVLQDDPDLNMDLGIVQPGRYPSLSRPTPEVEARLRAEIKRIDPLEADAIMRILLANLSIDEVQHSLANKNFLNSKYTSAKKEIIRRQENQHAAQLASDIFGPSVGDEVVQPDPPREPAFRSPPPLEPIPIEAVDLDSLARLPTRDIVTHLSGPIGDAILFKLEIARPDSREEAAIARWTQRVMTKPQSAKKSEIATQIIKKLDVSFPDDP